MSLGCIVVQWDVGLTSNLLCVSIGRSGGQLADNINWQSTRPGEAFSSSKTCDFYGKGYTIIGFSADLMPSLISHQVIGALGFPSNACDAPFLPLKNFCTTFSTWDRGNILRAPEISEYEEPEEVRAGRYPTRVCRRGGYCSANKLDMEYLLIHKEKLWGVVCCAVLIL